MAVRLGRISEDERAAVAAVFRSEWHAFSVVNVTQPLVELAAELAEAKSLRGFDAIHLASSVLIYPANPCECSVGAGCAEVLD